MVSEGWEWGGLGCFGLGVCASQLGLLPACQISHMSFPSLAPLEIWLQLRHYMDHPCGSSIAQGSRGVPPGRSWHIKDVQEIGS